MSGRTVRPSDAGEHEITLSGTVHRYQLRRSSRTTLAITVTPGGALEVTAPSGATKAQIEAVLRRRRLWIRRRMQESALLPPPPKPRAWVSGETHRYLGRQYRLKVVTGAKESVRLSSGYFRVVVPDRDDTRRVQRLMERWYREHAHETFARRLHTLVGRHARLCLTKPPGLLLRRMRTRWGSCTPEGRIILNVDAVKLSAACLDYLLIHELCHLREPHHGPRFWRLLEACLPDWERWRARLQLAEI